MEFEGDEASHLRPKRSKHTNPSQFSSTSMEPVSLLHSKSSNLSTTEMESEGDEASRRRLHSKRRKPTKHSQFPSTSMQESSLTIPTLPEELISEILLKLPVKYILQMRCVSKSWLDLISSPEFVKAHLSSSANNKYYTHHRLMLCSSRAQYNFKHGYLSSLLYDSVTRVCRLDNSMNKPCDIVEIVGSVNGLICLNIGHRDLFLWNPSIRKFKKLPDSRTTLMCGYHSMFGFGNDELHDDYKVVAIFRTLFVDSLYCTEVKIYSLKSDSWTSNHVSRIRVSLYYKCGKFVNGKLHWITQTRDIICFDLADRKWGKVEQPCYGEGKLNFRLSLGVLGGDLSLFCYYEGMTTHVDLWIMKKYGVKESWTKMFNINHPADLVQFLFYPPFFMSNKGDFLFQFVSTFMVYNPKDDSLRNLEVTNCDVSFEASVYIESLVWPIFPKGSKDLITTKA